MELDKIVLESDKLARKEIERYSLPALIHYELSYKKALDIAKILKTNISSVQIGVALMDLKLGEAFKKGILAEHVTMSLEASKDFLQNKIDDKTLGVILNCIEAHHGKVPYKYIEAEICANADCYRFIHPTGVFFYLSNLGKRGLTPIQIFNQAETKLDEKWNIISLEYVKNDLESHYSNFKRLLSIAKEETQE